MDTLLPLRPSATRRVQGIDHLVPPSQERLYAAGRGVVRGPFEVLVEHVLKDGLVWVGAREERHGRLQLLGIDRAEDLDRVRRLEPSQRAPTHTRPSFRTCSTSTSKGPLTTPRPAAYSRSCDGGTRVCDHDQPARNGYPARPAADEFVSRPVIGAKRSP